MVVINRSLFALLGLLFSGFALSATLPEDTVETLYHSYDGGGVKIDGPALLVRKSVSNNISLSGQYYVDSISGASIDVQATASAYEEEHTEVSGGIDFLQDKTMMSLNYINSTENDYDAQAVSFNVSQDVFAAMTTLSFGYTNGWDDITRTGSPDFEEEATHQIYRFGVSQIITRNSLAEVNFELSSDEGFLNNQYRVARFCEDSPCTSTRDEAELTPETRTSNAVSLRYAHYLPYRASISAWVRHFSDSWGIRGFSTRLDYVNPIGRHWMVEGRLRYHTQGDADFYSDLITDTSTTPRYYARDKELSEMSSVQFGGGVSYVLERPQRSYINRFRFGLQVDFIQYEYDNFTNRVVEQDQGLAPGTAPLYEFDAWVTRFSIFADF